MNSNNNNDRVKGKMEQVKGETKKTWGKATNDDSKVAEGERDKDKGKVQETIGKAKDKFGGNNKI
ncbi:CsbD family protein [Pseudalkalibacillus decolorationis]|uniref:CsbD family protein n=1 Tax=Pseudalkalibacillus decolorationis TaxID=163879 RepID=UPI002148C97C|nr:CsbD family protein [Pseudalkalibacillus decolorationis]